MKTADQVKKENFEKIWNEKIENSQYEFVEYWLFSNRQIPVWKEVSLKTRDGLLITAKVVKKPFYTDKFWKARYLWYLVLQDNSKNIIIAHVDNIFKK